MDIQNNLIIDTLVSNEDGMVEAINYRFFADGGGDCQAALSKSIELAPPGEDATPFDELSEDQVSEWILSGYSSEELDEIYADLDKQVVELRKPPRNRKPPWTPARKPKLRAPKGERDRRQKPDTKPGRG